MIHHNILPKTLKNQQNLFVTLSRLITIIKSTFLLCKYYFKIFSIFFTFFGFFSTNMGNYSELSSSIYPASLCIFWKQQGKSIFQSDRFP